MKFKIDENLPQDVAQLLRENGHDALSVFDQTLSGETNTDQNDAAGLAQRPPCDGEAGEGEALPRKDA